MYYRARYYAQSIGRFISADTVVPDGKNPQQFNRYAYGLNSPLNFTDPSGHAALCPDCDGIGLGGIFEAYRYWNDRPDDLRMALKSFFEAHPDYDLNLSADGKDGFRSGLREGDWSDAAFSQMWVGMDRNGWDGASKYFAVVSAAGIIAEGNGPNGDGLSGLLGGNKAASTCGACGTVRPDLVRTRGKFDIDDDGASFWCRTCTRNGQSGADSNEKHWIWTYDEVEMKALSVNGQPPEYTPQYGNGRAGHFSAFKGTDQSWWSKLNDWIRSGGAKKP
jgi:hypothetical protein